MYRLLRITCSSYELGKTAEQREPDERTDRGQREAGPPGSRGHESGEGNRRGGSDAGEHGLLNPDRRTASAPSGELGRRRERQPVPRHRQSAGDDEGGDENP